MRLGLVAAIMMLVAQDANADTAGEFCNDAGVTYVLCQLEKQLVAMGGDPGEHAGECDANSKKLAKRFASVKKSTGGEALPLLKDFYATFLTAASTAGPREGETERDYQKRTSDASADLSQRCNRIKIEE